MKKKIITLILLIFTLFLAASYNVGDVVEEINFRDNESNKSLYSLISQKKAVVFFWGYYP